MTSAYLVFAGPEYYPLGGTRDFVGAAPDLYSAQVLLETRIRDLGADARYHINWAHIANWDGDRLVIVAEWCPDHRKIRAEAPAFRRGEEARPPDFDIVEPPCYTSYYEIDRAGAPLPDERPARRAQADA